MTHDPIHNPSHYAEGRKYETIDVIEDWALSYRLGNAVKYISRAGRKDPSKTAEDLKKAIWYINREIEALEGSRSSYSVPCQDVLRPATFTRVYELAHEMGCTNREVMEACDSLNIRVEKHSSALALPDVTKVRDFLAGRGVTYEDVLQDAAYEAANGSVPLYEYGITIPQADVDDSHLPFWDSDEDYMWDPSLGPVDLTDDEIRAIMAKKDLSMFDKDEIVATVEKRGFILGIKKDGSTCELGSNGRCV